MIYLFLDMSYLFDSLYTHLDSNAVFLLNLNLRFSMKIFLTSTFNILLSLIEHQPTNKRGYPCYGILSRCTGRSQCTRLFYCINCLQVKLLAQDAWRLDRQNLFTPGRYQIDITSNKSRGIFTLAEFEKWMIATLLDHYSLMVEFELPLAGQSTMDCREQASVRGVKGVFDPTLGQSMRSNPRDSSEHPYLKRRNKPQNLLARLLWIKLRQ